jgi:hypothetical protein
VRRCQTGLLAVSTNFFVNPVGTVYFKTIAYLPGADVYYLTLKSSANTEYSYRNVATFCFIIAPHAVTFTVADMILLDEIFVRRRTFVRFLHIFAAVLINCNSLDLIHTDVLSATSK